MSFVTWHKYNSTERQVLELLTRAGGLGIIISCKEASVYQYV